MAKDVGDYSIEKCVIERKTLGDFINSIYARYGKHGRMWDQADALFNYCKEHGAIGYVIVHGNWQRTEEEFKQRGQTLGYNAIFGAIASLMVRYDLNIVFIDRPIDDVLLLIKSILEKVEEGKVLVPQRKYLKQYARWRSNAVVSVALDVSPKLAARLVSKFGGLYGILDAIKNHPKDVLVMEGIGLATFEKMKALGGIVQQEVMK